MKLSLDNAGDLYQITAFDHGTITINEVTYRSSLIVSGNRLITDWPVARLGALSADDLAPLLELGVEVVLLGTGHRLRFPHPATTRLLSERGIGIEVMDTAAACRTYNVLISEGRAVAAALIVDGDPGSGE